MTKQGTFSVVALVAALVAAGPAHAAKAPKVTIRVLSNRAHLISGGDALVRVTPKGAKVTVGKKDVTGAFALRPDGRYEALLTGLPNGPDVVTARKGRGAARITILNHAIGGPVTGGPQIQPWTCFDGALDAQCNRAPTIAYSYMPSGGGGFQSYDPDNPPSDVAMTTTD